MLRLPLTKACTQLYLRLFNQVFRRCNHLGINLGTDVDLADFVSRGHTFLSNNTFIGIF
jgi:hypothetical protein